MCVQDEVWWKKDGESSYCKIIENKIEKVKSHLMKDLAC